MMKESVFRLVESSSVSSKVRLLRFSGDSSAISAPGQFVSLSLPGKFLRRPFSVCDWDAEWFSILVENVGAGTSWLHALSCGSELSVLTGLGTGFSFTSETPSPVLVGGGSGLSPLVGLARRMVYAGLQPRVLLGFRREEERFGLDFFPDLSARYIEDVFSGLRHFSYESVYACGSEQLMRKLARSIETEGQFAFDVRMGCGFGVCMGCSVHTPGRMKRVCRDGPVFRKEDLLWEG